MMYLISGCSPNLLIDKIIIYFRNPIFVKNLLRPIRVGLGPTSIMVALYTSFIHIIQHREVFFFDIMRLCCAIVVLVSTFCAGILFRPDNLEVFTHIQHTMLNPLPVTMKILKTLGITQRKEGIELKAVHGVLNLMSVLMSLVILSTYTLIEI